jgi:hypothetical protein
MQIKVFRCLVAVQLLVLVFCQDQLARNLDDRRIVKTEYGLVQGVVRQTVLGREYLSFQGIPYMKPPLGKLRFKAPEPPVKWTTTFDASRDSAGYTRFNPLKEKIVGVENAGVINVYTTFSSRAVRLPVLVWIHGGSFSVSEANGNSTEAFITRYSRKVQATPSSSVPTTCFKKTSSSSRSIIVSVLLVS